MIKPKNGYLVCFILAIVFHCVPIHGAIIIVPDNYKTIQEAIDEASWGDTVIVEDGVYKGVGNRNISFNGKILTLKSRNGQEHTTIDCEYLDRGFTFTQNEGYKAIIDGFTIQNGYASEGGGIYCSNSSPLIKNCTITNCEANYGPGGGIYGENSSLSLDNCVIDSNKACNFGGGLYFFDGFPYVKNCQVINNMIKNGTSGCQRLFGWGNGGGVYYKYNWASGIEDLAIFENTIFSGNSSSAYGGGMYYSGTDKSYVSITGCTFSSNEASQGGGLYGGNKNTVVSNTIFEKNNATGYGGGGIASSTSVFIDCKIRNNTSDGAGGGFYSGWAGSNPVLKGCEFNGNIAHGYYGGGGICLNNNASPKIIGCEFYNNSAMDGQGGGINLSYHAYNNEEKRGEIINCIFADNYAFEEGGAIIFDTWCGDTEIPFHFMNNTITQNSGSNGGGIYNTSELHIQNSIVYYNTPNDIVGNEELTTVSYCNTTDLIDGVGNISEFPEFVGNGDYHLSPKSPCIDVGNNNAIPGVTEDIDGEIRIYDGDGNGTAYVDMGAYEYPGTEILNTYYRDNDNDGYGDSKNPYEASSLSSGYVTDNTDCNDNDNSIHPGATEIRGDGIDQDCNGSDLPPLITYYRDSDNDGYGDPNTSQDAETQPAGYVTDNTDCDDSDSTIHPSATENQNHVDDNCDGIVDNIIPAKVTHTSPSGTTEDTTPTLIWNEEPYSTWYKLFIWDSSEQEVYAQWYDASEICFGGNCTVTLGTELPSGNFEWWIKSWNDSGRIWSDGMAFTIQTGGTSPSKITHSSPSGTTQDSTPTFTWPADPASTWYKLWVGYPGDIKVFAQWYEASEICSDGNCTVTTGTGFDVGTYEWYIKSWNDYGKVWSDGMSFSLGN